MHFKTVYDVLYPKNNVAAFYTTYGGHIGF